MESAAPDLHVLAEQGFEELQRPLDVRGRELLVAFAQMVAARNEVVNLTGHQTAEAILRTLVLDAAALSCVLPDFESLSDLGSGAGFPGIPLAILYPERSFTLVEARGKRHSFQRAALRSLALDNVEARRGRAEDLHPTVSDAVIAQAMGAPAQVVDWGLRWVREGGWLAIPGGPTAPQLGAQPRLQDIQVRDYRVPLGGRARTLWLART